MRRYLLAALWPAGMAAIGAATVVAARRAAAGSSPPAQPTTADGPGNQATGTAAGFGTAGARDAGSVLGSPVGARVLQGYRKVAGPEGGLPADLARLAAMSAVSGVVSYGVMTLLGPTVINNGPAIDEPMYRWVNRHQVRVWAAVMERANKIGNTWTTWGAAYTAAACLAVSYPRKKWLPPTALGAAIVVDHYATLALRRTFGRPGPPGSPGGTYPSGGTDRVILFYGMIAHMLWREFSGTPQGRVYALGSMAALAFNQAYAREYCSKHWFTDIITGLLYGGILLAPFMAAVRWIAGPPVAGDGLPPGRGAGDSGSAGAQ